MSKPITAGIALIVALAAAFTAHAFQNAAQHKDTVTTATYMITGLHCPPCTRTVESSLSKAEGIRSIKVDWAGKNARIEFDEAVAPAQRVAQWIAATPHMMGSGMHYEGWLVLKTPELNDEAAAQKAKDALSKVAGVKSVATFPAQRVLEVQFDSRGQITSKQLIDALGQAGITASN